MPAEEAGFGIWFTLSITWFLLSLAWAMLMSVCSKTQRNRFLLHKNTPNVTVLFFLAFNFRSRVCVFVFLLLVWSVLQLVAGGRLAVLSCSMRPLVSESKQRDATDYIYRTSSAGCRVRTAQRLTFQTSSTSFDVLFFESKRRIHHCPALPKADFQF
jgi:hypothetical protein